MSVEQFINFIVKHNALIIEVLIGITVVLALFAAFRDLFKADDGGGAVLGSTAELEETLKKLLEKANQVPSLAAAAGSMATGDNAQLINEINALKAELEAKKNQIDELGKTAGAGATAAAPAPGLSDEEKAKLETQLKELQGKLAEYEIISEDIADLSFYKEQNAKLQKELEALKGAAPAGAATAAPQAPPVAEVSAPPPPPPEPVVAAPVVETVASVEPTPAAAPESAASAKSEPAITGKAKATPAVPPEADSELTPIPVQQPPPAPAAEVSNVVDDSLMAEFDAAVEKQKADKEEEPKADSSEGVDLGQMDMDKMMAEAAVIPTEVPEVTPEQALGQGLDENKLLQEASALEAPAGEDAKLMGQFENFVKKS